jgi:uncharacterized membrane protein
VKLALVHILFLTNVGTALSQVGQTDSVAVSLTVPEEIGAAENLFEQFETESEELQLIEDLQYLRDHPHDLNTIRQEELEALPGVTPSEAAAVIKARKLVRRFESVTQLAFIEGGNDELVEKVRPYVYTQSRATDSGGGVVEFRSRTTRDLQPRRGFQDGTFLGSELKSYNRFNYKYGEHGAGILYEKDAGERTQDGFLSGYLVLKDVGLLDQWIVGDYTVESGQGLVFWSSSSFGKGGENIMGARKSGTGVKPYRSAGEFHFLRGIATSTEFPAFNGTMAAAVFVSRRALDGSVNQDDAVTSFYDAGLFRTENELRRRRSMDETLIGARARYSTESRWSVGSTIYHSTLSKPSATNVQPDNQTVVGIDGTLQIERLNFFTEVARTREGGKALLAGVVLSVTKTTSVLGSYREYASTFHNLHSVGFGETGNTTNERGLYIGIQSTINRWLRVTGYMDQFRFPSRTFSNPLPAKGHEIFMQADLSPNRPLRLAVRYATKTVEMTQAALDEYSRSLRLVTDRTQEKARVSATYQVSREVRVRGRVEVTRVRYALSGNNERGTLLFQDVLYNNRRGFSAEARIVFFHTDSFDSRLYEFENDLRGVFSNPALYGKGRRWYVLLRYQVFDLLSISMKYAETQKEGVQSISSGLSEIIGDTDNRLSVQVDVVW